LLHSSILANDQCLVFVVEGFTYHNIYCYYNSCCPASMFASANMHARLLCHQDRTWICAILCHWTCHGSTRPM